MSQSCVSSTPAFLRVADVATFYRVNNVSRTSSLKRLIVTCQLAICNGFRIRLKQKKNSSAALGLVSLFHELFSFNIKDGKQIS